jgi:hypothetical protein
MVLPLDFQNHGGLGQNVVKDVHIASFRLLFKADREEDPVQRLTEFDGNFQEPGGSPRLNTSSFKDITLVGELKNPGVTAPANQVFEAVQFFSRIIQGTVITHRIGEVEAQSPANPPELGGYVHLFHITLKIILE